MFNERIVRFNRLMMFDFKYTETDMLEINPARLAFKNLMLEEFCNSHCISHLAAFFIVIGAKISIAENFLFFEFDLTNTI